MCLCVFGEFRLLYIWSGHCDCRVALLDDIKVCSSILYTFLCCVVFYFASVTDTNATVHLTDKFTVVHRYKMCCSLCDAPL